MVPDTGNVPLPFIPDVRYNRFRGCYGNYCDKNHKKPACQPYRCSRSGRQNRRVEEVSLRRNPVWIRLGTMRCLSRPLVCRPWLWLSYNADSDNRSPRRHFYLWTGEESLATLALLIYFFTLPASASSPVALVLAGLISLLPNL